WIGGCESVPIPDVSNLLVAIVGRKLGEVAIGGVVPPIGHHSTVIADPFALDINILDRNRSPGDTVGGDTLELSSCLCIPLAMSRVHGESPASAFALGSIDQLSDTDIGVEPFGPALCEVQTQKLSQLWPRTNILSLPNSLRAHVAISSVSAIMRSGVRVGAIFSASLNR